MLARQFQRTRAWHYNRSSSASWPMSDTSQLGGQPWSAKSYVSLAPVLNTPFIVQPPKTWSPRQPFIVMAVYSLKRYVPSVWISYPPFSPLPHLPSSSLQTLSFECQAIRRYTSLWPSLTPSQLTPLYLWRLYLPGNCTVRFSSTTVLVIYGHFERCLTPSCPLRSFYFSMSLVLFYSPPQPCDLLGPTATFSSTALASFVFSNLSCLPFSPSTLPPGPL